MESAIQTMVKVFLKSTKGKESLGQKQFQDLVKNQLSNILSDTESKEAVNNMGQGLDADHDGKVGFEEYMKLVGYLAVSLSEQRNNTREEPGQNAATEQVAQSAADKEEEKPEANAEAKEEAKPEEKEVAKEEADAEVKVEANADPKVEVKVEAAKTEPEPEAAAEEEKPAAAAAAVAGAIEAAAAVVKEVEKVEETEKVEEAAEKLDAAVGGEVEKKTDEATS